MSYETEKINTGPLTRCFSGYYSEMFIQNNTRNNVVLIDCNNNKINVPPITGNHIGRELVTVWLRKSTTPSVDQNNRSTQLPGLRISIPLHDLNREGGFFIDEINMVLCTEATAMTASHPKSSITFADAADQARADISKILDESPTLKLIANDPEGRYNKLFTTFGDMLVEIDVQHMYGEAELEINYFYKGKQDSFIVDLDEFFNGEDETLELEDLPISFITTNKAKALRYTGEYKRVPQSEVDELLKRAAAKAAKDIAAVKDQYETELKLKDNELKRITDDLKNVTSERDQLDVKLKELNAIINASNTMREKEVKSQELANKAHISDNNLDISHNDVKTSESKRDSAEKESKFKLWHLIAAASIPTAGALLLKIASSNTSKQIIAKQLISNQMVSTSIIPKLICFM